jgi:hypothetical protein
MPPDDAGMLYATLAIRSCAKPAGVAKMAAELDVAGIVTLAQVGLAGRRANWGD